MWKCCRTVRQQGGNCSKTCHLVRYLKENWRSKVRLVLLSGGHSVILRITLHQGDVFYINQSLRSQQGMSTESPKCCQTMSIQIPSNREHICNNLTNSISSTCHQLRNDQQYTSTTVVLMLANNAHKAPLTVLST